MTEPAEPDDPPPPAPSGGRGLSRGARAASIAVALGAVATLVAVRIGDDGDGAGTSAASIPSVTSTTRAGDGTGERGLAEPPSKLTAAQLGGIRFTDVTEAAGLAAPQSSLPLTADHAMTSGAAVADVDRDGRLDVLVTRLGRPNALYRNLGGMRFADVTADSGLSGAAGASSGAAAFADIDGDGCLDLYVAGAETTESILWVSDCRGHFTDQTAARGVSLPAAAPGLGGQGHGVTWADYDHDGDLDLLVLHWDPAFLAGTAGAAAATSITNPTSTCQKAAEIRRLGADRVAEAGPNRSRLFANDGRGRFRDATAETGLPLDRIAGFTGDFVDVDGDGWEDLAITGDFCTSALFHNDQGRRFVDVTAARGLGTDENGMGSVVRDIDGDGRPDWFISSIALRTPSGSCAIRLANSGCSGNRLFVARPDDTFRDATDDFGLRHGGWGWGAAIEDFGNDGRLEVAQTNGTNTPGTGYEVFHDDRTRFWVPTGTGDRHEDGAALAGITDTDVGHALVAFDADDDGDLDLLVANFGGPPRLYRNDTPRRHWLTVRLDDPSRPGNRQGLGARIVVTGARPTTGWISTGGSYETQRPAELHVGLGDRSDPVRVEVWWPGASSPQTLDVVDPDRVLTVTRSAT